MMLHSAGRSCRTCIDQTTPEECFNVRYLRQPRGPGRPGAFRGGRAIDERAMIDLRYLLAAATRNPSGVRRLARFLGAEPGLERRDPHQVALWIHRRAAP